MFPQIKNRLRVYSTETFLLSLSLLMVFLINNNSLHETKPHPKIFTYIYYENELKEESKKKRKHIAT
jgi:hypothetical protein